MAEDKWIKRSFSTHINEFAKVHIPSVHVLTLIGDMHSLKPVLYRHVAGQFEARALLCTRFWVWVEHRTTRNSLLWIR